MMILLTQTNGKKITINVDRIIFIEDQGGEIWLKTIDGTNHKIRETPEEVLKMVKAVNAKRK